MKKIETIDKILEAAKKEISLKGIDGARMETIAREAGVTKQLVYHYFKTKDQLYSAILENVSQEISILADMDSYKALSPEDAIRRIVNTLFDGFIENPAYATLAHDQGLHAGEHITRASHFPPTMRIFIAEVLSPILERGSANGGFKPALNPHLTFWMIFNLAAGCFMNGKIMSHTSGVDFCSTPGIEIWRNAITDFVLDALRA